MSYTWLSKFLIKLSNNIFSNGFDLMKKTISTLITVAPYNYIMIFTVIFILIIYNGYPKIPNVM
jgi:hypothetical protein